MNKEFYLVAGLGKTGHSIARYLQRKKCDFAMFDTRKSPKGLDDFTTEFPNIDVFLESIPDELYTKLTEVIASPGVDPSHPVIHKARSLGISVVGDIECFAREVKAPVIAITGTNGKSTVTTLVSEMATEAGLLVAMAGNIGLPVLDLLDDGKQYDLWVLELSSFQLELTCSLTPLVAIILNITPDHLDRHHTMREYKLAKHRVYHNAKYIVYNREDLMTVPSHNESNTVSSFGLNYLNSQWSIIEEANKVYLAHGDIKLLSVDKLKIKGRHNWVNALAASAVANYAGVDFTSIINVLQKFAGLPHRTQWVRTLNGVEWINDSKGTNIGATISAISGIGGAIAGKIVLIAGGQGKGADFTELKPLVLEYVRCVVLLGEDAEKIKQALVGTVELHSVVSLKDAVHKSFGLAQSGDVVLLSPACASLDMFNDFNHRGEVFVSLVEEL